MHATSLHTNWLAKEELDLLSPGSSGGVGVVKTLNSQVNDLKGGGGFSLPPPSVQCTGLVIIVIHVATSQIILSF